MTSLTTGATPAPEDVSARHAVPGPEVGPEVEAEVDVEVEVEPTPHDGSLPAAAAQAALGATVRSVADLVGAVGGPLLRMTVRCGQASIELEWAGRSRAPVGGAVGAPTTVSTAEPPADSDQDAGTRTGTRTDTDVGHIRAPLVGTFYHGSEPGAQPFVAVGDDVEVGQPVGIVEAMKLMNVVEADRAGHVVEVLVPNGTAVEYDQELIAVARSDA